MANSVLTPDKILVKSADVLHGKLNYISSINRSYDSQFANDGGKIGESLRIRLPEKYTVTDGATMQVQDSVEQSTTMTVATQKHVAMNFTARELTMSIDEFTERKIIPAMSVLASAIEADALTMAYDIYNMVGTTGTPSTTLAPFLKAKARLNQYLAPNDNRRMALVDSVTSTDLVEGLKALQEASAELTKQYKEGIMGRAAGLTWAENDLLPVQTLGTRTGSITIDGAAPTGSTIALKALGSGTTLKKGEVFTIAGYYAVHPETKQAYSHLQQFVVTADKTASGTTIASLAIAPAIVTSGAYQNVSGTPGADAVVIFKGGADCGGAAAAAGAGTSQGLGLIYHPDAFAFVTADLEDMSQYGAWGSRKVIDGISMRIWRQGNITNDTVPTRIDVLYGYKTIRPELAVRYTR